MPTLAASEGAFAPNPRTNFKADKAGSSGVPSCRIKLVISSRGSDASQRNSEFVRFIRKAQD
jgi:hypothetical protein